MAADTLQAVVLRPKRDKPVRQRHPWIFSGAIRSLPDGASDGDVVDVLDAGGSWLARGYLNRKSQIQVRLLTWRADEPIDEAFWRDRLSRAIANRRGLLASGETSAVRLVNGESDYLPGLIVDQYGHHLVLQAGTLGIDVRKEMLARLLLELTGADGVYERSDMAARHEEGLVEARGLLAGVMPADRLEVRENGHRFQVDVAGGQKTGFYLDQRDNRRRVAEFCRDARVLNAFGYTGAFGVYVLAAEASHVTNIDNSADALRQSAANLRLNGFEPTRQSRDVVGNVFEVLRVWRDQRDPDHLFDVVILDPPKFAQNKRGVERALRGYKDVNMLAMQMLKPGGILATFSCSGLVSADLFQKVVFGATVDVGRDAQIIANLRQSEDHPIAITFPEGDYLKGLICRIL